MSRIIGICKLVLFNPLLDHWQLIVRRYRTSGSREVTYYKTRHETQVNDTISRFGTEDARSNFDALSNFDDLSKSQYEPTVVNWHEDTTEDRTPNQSSKPQTLAFRRHPTRAQVQSGPITLPASSNIGKSETGRNQHRRSDLLTDVCGHITPATGTPVKKISGKEHADYHCPRCDSTATRPRTIKDHFPACIRKHGNPQGLKYTDHPSMAKAEAFRLRSLDNRSQPQTQGFASMNSDKEVDRRDDWLSDQ